MLFRSTLATGATSGDIVEAIAYNTVNVGTITASLIYNSYTATAGQTSFTTTNSYTANKIQVSINGVILVNGTDCTVSGGTTFTTTALTSGDRVLAIYPI